MQCSKCQRVIYLGPRIATKRRRGEIIHFHRICPSKKRPRGKKKPKRLPTRHFRRWADGTAPMFFVDKRSFVSLGAHLVLFGKDKAEQRKRIFARADGQCEIRTSPNCTGSITEESGQWHHKDNRPGHRCDCLHNAAAGCVPCHELETKHRLDYRRPEARS